MTVSPTPDHSLAAQPAIEDLKNALVMANDWPPDRITMRRVVALLRDAISKLDARAP